MKLAIKGHAERGNEVIEILEILGGYNANNHYGNHCDKVYYINENGYIDWDFIFRIEQYTKFIIFSLEEFLEKFPYKVGDKVYYKPIPQINSVCISEIISMRWIDGSVVYYTSNGHEVYVCDLQPYKEETMEEKGTLVQIDLTRELCVADEVEVILGDYEFVLKDGKTYFVKKKPQYPKTFIEVLNFWHPDRQIEDDYQRYYKKDLIEKFQDLLYARDAYWKIAGDWEEKRKEKTMHYVIYSSLLGEVVKDTMPNCIANYLLDFPTKEMRDTFYKNFKDLIEQCKELL